MKQFSELPLSAYLQDRLVAANFVTATPVQASTIPPALEGKDVLATAQTGTGKTMAFLLPIMQHMLHSKPNGIYALVLVPTRELAMQIVGQYNLLRGKKFPPAAQIVGGLSEKEQIKTIREGAEVVIATPGRLEDLVDRRLIDLKHLKVLVLDEADRMLDMGFIPAIRRIVGALPKNRQTMCFSATLEASVQHIIGDYVKKPVRIEHGSILKPHENVTLRAYEVSNDKKMALLEKLLKDEPGRYLVFARTKRGCERLAKRLTRDGFKAGMIHGDRSQPQRNAALADFQRGRSQLLIATDVASRGIHVDDIAHVVNYDFPTLAEDFVHRVGRTARAGARGVATTFVNWTERTDLIKLERALGVKIERMNVAGDLEAEERVGPVDTSNLVPTRASKDSRMMKLPGEVLQRYV
ncbi:MAG: DEAD/DEAH box helicase [Candidatus Koribacter versatilis]|uniref:DEAD/DEAH box helicase n=1 Tax=Candidatus Korobacter versatilis TaxID=658062 RepID=A0A932ENR1_9BACT|nr:DEAD/DEAH box helicase [Candidatus Koribacter versatilis]